MKFLGDNQVYNMSSYTFKSLNSHCMKELKREHVRFQKTCRFFFKKKEAGEIESG